MAPLLSAVIQPTPSILRMASICTLEIMPRSPTMISEAMPKLSRTFSTCGKSVLGSAVLPSKTETATGQPRASVSRP